MTSLGMRISQDGVDVKTGSDEEMILTSEYSMLKGSTAGTGTVVVPRDGSTTTVTSPHGLGYIPMVQALFSDRNMAYWNTDNYILFPVYDTDGSTEFFCSATADSTNVYLNFGVSDF